MGSFRGDSKTLRLCQIGHQKNYDREKQWPAESLMRRQALMPLIEAYQASQRGDA